MENNTEITQSKQKDITNLFYNLSKEIKEVPKRCFNILIIQKTKA